MSFNFIIMSKCLKRQVKRFSARVMLGVCFINPANWGEKIWDRLDKTLPEAVGATFNDAPRIEAFKEKAKKLNFLQHYALCKFLRREIKELEEGFSEFATLREEELERKYKQIYKEHLAAIAYV